MKGEKHSAIMSSKDHRRSARILELEAKKAQQALEKRKAMHMAAAAQGSSPGKDQSSRKHARKKVKGRSVQDLGDIPVEQQTHKITDALNDGGQQGNANQAAARYRVTATAEISKLGLLLSIIERIDSDNIFAHPVDPNKVAGYYNVIKNPMDFSTIAARLRKGKYKTLEEFEADVYLVFNNAMLFNSSHTVFYKEARAIKEVARKLFHALRSKPESFEAEFSILKLETGKFTKAESRLINSYFSDKNLCENQSNQIASGGFCGRRHETSVQQPRDTYKPFVGQRESLISSIYQGPKPLILRNPMYSYGDSLRSFCQGLGKSAQTFAIRKLQNIISNDGTPIPSCAWAPKTLNDSSVCQDFDPFHGLNVANLGLPPGSNLVMNLGYQSEEASQTFKSMLPAISETKPYFDLNQVQSPIFEVNGAGRIGMSQESRPLLIDFLGLNDLSKQSTPNVTKDGVPKQSVPFNFNLFRQTETLQHQDRPFPPYLLVANSLDINESKGKSTPAEMHDRSPFRDQSRSAL